MSAIQWRLPRRPDSDLTATECFPAEASSIITAEGVEIATAEA